MPTWLLASLQTDLRHIGIEPPVQIPLWPNRPPPLLASGRAPGSIIKGVFSKVTDLLKKKKKKEHLRMMSHFAAKLHINTFIMMFSIRAGDK